MSDEFTTHFLGFGKTLTKEEMEKIFGTFVGRILDMGKNLVPLIAPETARGIIQHRIGHSPYRRAVMSLNNVSYELLGVTQNEFNFLTLSDAIEQVATIQEQNKAAAVTLPTTDEPKDESTSAEPVSPSTAGYPYELKKATLAKTKQAARAIIMAGIFATAIIQMQGRRFFNTQGWTDEQKADFVHESFFLPEVIVGTMPIYCVQRIERGLSDMVLKYRAIGDVFLAHQKGGMDTLRIDGRLSGPYRKMNLLYLIMLQFIGRTKVKDISQLPNINDIIAASGTSEATDADSEYPSNVTFPIITQTDIMLDMYLQTIEWHHSIETGGLKFINYHMLFRKYVEPKDVKLFDGKRVLDPKPAEASRRRLEAALDLAWKMGRIGVESFRVMIADGKPSVEWNSEAIYSDPYFRQAHTLMAGIGAEIVEMIGGTQ